MWSLLVLLLVPHRSRLVDLDLFGTRLVGRVLLALRCLLLAMFVFAMLVMHLFSIIIGCYYIYFVRFFFIFSDLT